VNVLELFLDSGISLTRYSMLYLTTVIFTDYIDETLDYLFKYINIVNSVEQIYIKNSYVEFHIKSKIIIIPKRIVSSEKFEEVFWNAYKIIESSKIITKVIVNEVNDKISFVKFYHNGISIEFDGKFFIFPQIQINFVLNRKILKLREIYSIKRHQSDDPLFQLFGESIIVFNVTSMKNVLELINILNKYSRYPLVLVYSDTNNKITIIDKTSGRVYVYKDLSKFAKFLTNKECHMFIDGKTYKYKEIVKNIFVIESGGKEIVYITRTRNFIDILIINKTIIINNGKHRVKIKLNKCLSRNERIELLYTLRLLVEDITNNKIKLISGFIDVNNRILKTPVKEQSFYSITILLGDSLSTYEKQQLLFSLPSKFYKNRFSKSLELLINLLLASDIII